MLLRRHRSLRALQDEALVNENLIAKAGKIGIVTLTLQVHPLVKHHSAGLAVPLSKLASKWTSTRSGRVCLPNGGARIAACLICTLLSCSMSHEESGLVTHS